MMHVTFVDGRIAFLRRRVRVSSGNAERIRRDINFNYTEHFVTAFLLDPVLPTFGAACGARLCPALARGHYVELNARK